MPDALARVVRVLRLADRWSSVGELRTLKLDDTNVVGLLYIGGFIALFAIGLLWHEVSFVSNHDGPPASAEVAGATQAPEGDKVWIPAGMRLDEVAAMVDNAGITDGAAFLQLADDPAQARELLGPEWGEVSSLQGYLAPGEYVMPPGLSAEEVVATMVGEFKSQLPSGWKETAADLGLSPSDLIILASIVERESNYYSDSPAIAGVFFNRLRLGLPLESDPTVAYALTLRSISEAGLIRGWSARITPEDLQTPSPYNTYLNTGLPPSPIANPSAEAIKAVLWPADADYMFFTAKPNGAHAFARTAEEQDRNFDLYSFAEDSPAPEDSKLHHLLARMVEPLDAHVGIVVKNLYTSEYTSINASDYFTAASIYKPYVMAYAYREREQGRLSFEERIAISAEAASHDNDIVRQRLGSNPAISEALEQMIVVSSSGAGETLLERFGRSSVEGFLHNRGLVDTYMSEARIVTTPADVANFMEQVANGGLVSTQASSDMVATLSRQELNDLMRKYLPPETVFAHKTGSLDYPSHDAGVLYTKAGPVVIVMMTEDAGDKSLASETIAQVGKLVYDYYEVYRPAAEATPTLKMPGCGEPGDSPRGSGRLAGRVIVLDPRLGNAPAQLPDGSTLTEGDVSLDVSLRLKALLVAEGATVGLTRCGAEGASDMTKALFANSISADLFITLGMNASDDPSRDGVEVTYTWRDGRVLANYMLGTFAQPALWKTLASSFALANAGVSYEDSEALRYTATAGIVTESVYLTNPQEAALLADTSSPGSRRDEIAQGHLKGILNYFESLFPEH